MTEFVVHYQAVQGDVGVIHETVTRITVQVDAWIEINRELRKQYGERYKIISYVEDDFDDVAQALAEYFT